MFILIITLLEKCCSYLAKWSSCLIYLNPYTPKIWRQIAENQKLKWTWDVFLSCVFDLGEVWIKKKWLTITWLRHVSKEHPLIRGNHEPSVRLVPHASNPYTYLVGQSLRGLIWLAHVCYLVRNRSLCCKGLKHGEHMGLEEPWQWVCDNLSLLTS